MTNWICFQAAIGSVALSTARDKKKPVFERYGLTVSYFKKKKIYSLPWQGFEETRLSSSPAQSGGRMSGLVWLGLPIIVSFAWFSPTCSVFLICPNVTRFANHYSVCLICPGRTKITNHCSDCSICISKCILKSYLISNCLFTYKPTKFIAILT